MSEQDLLSDDMMTGIFLSSPTKGKMQLIKGSEWSFVEDLPEFNWVSPASAITSTTEM